MDGIMECCNNGIMLGKITRDPSDIDRYTFFIPNIPLFYYSRIPVP
jgi:hypothetical protein